MSRHISIVIVENRWQDREKALAVERQVQACAEKYSTWLKISTYTLQVFRQEQPDQNFQRRLLALEKFN